MRVRTAQKFAFDHPRYDQIAGIFGPAGDFFGAVNAVDRGSNDEKVANVCAQLSASFLINASRA
jgi:hypothetical protein